MTTKREVDETAKQAEIAQSIAAKETAELETEQAHAERLQAEAAAAQAERLAATDRATAAIADRVAESVTDSTPPDKLAQLAYALDTARRAAVMNTPAVAFPGVPPGVSGVTVTPSSP